VPLSPQLDGTQGISEGFLLGHYREHLIGDTDTIDAAQIGIIEAAEKIVVLEVDVLRD
jgi:hypothetical protein